MPNRTKLIKEICKGKEVLNIGDLPNTESFNLNKKFDVVVAEEILEHLSNPGRFLMCVKKHLKKNGVFVLTTPNCFSLRRIIGTMLLGTLNENEQHICYYSDVTLKQLLNRYGFKKVEVYYLDSEDKNILKRLIEQYLYCFFKDNLKHTLFVEARL